MDYLSVLQKDLDAGFTKSQLERLIGLPQNILSGVMKGDKKLSRKSELKIGAWEASDKPSPFDKPQKEKKSPKQTSKQPENPKADNATTGAKHPLWKEGDPKEGSMAFYSKYGCSTYGELEGI